MQEELPSLRLEREGDQGFPWLFVRPSRFLFVRKEGLFAEPSSASLGRWVSARLQEGPPSLYTKREGGQEFPWLLVRPSRILFVQTEGLFAEPPRVRAWVARSRQGCRKSPLASAWSERAVRGPLAFCTTLAHPFCLEGGVVCRALECEPRSLGLGKVAGRAP